MKKILNTLFIIIYCLLCVTNIDAQSTHFVYYGTEQGLPQSGVQNILQDQFGNLWLGTMAGVSKYDGRSFKTFTKRDGLSENWVTSSCIDKKGNIWFGHWAGGISMYNAAKKKMQTITVHGIPLYKSITVIHEDKNGTMWFGTEGSGVLKWIPSQGQVDSVNIVKSKFELLTQKEGLSGDNVYSIIEDKIGTLWFATNLGITQYKDGKFFPFNMNDFPSKDTRSLMQDHDENIWIGTADAGLIKYDVAQKSFNGFTTANEFPNNSIKTIFEDDAYNIWVGTYGGGVCRYNPKQNVFKTFNTNDGLSNNKVLSLMQDREKNIWIGTYIGLNQYRTEVFEIYGLQEGLNNNLVWSIMQDRNANFWMGTEGGLIKHTPSEKSFVNYTVGKGFNNNNVTSVFEDKEGFIWFSNWGEGISRLDVAKNKIEKFTVHNGLPSNNIYSIAADGDGNIWLGTDKNGACKYNFGTKNFEYFTAEQGLGNDRIYTIFKDSKNNLWFGSLGGYLTKYDGKTFRIFDEKDGLNYAFILCITEDKQGNIWFGSYGGGLFKYDGKTFQNYDINDGLNSDSPYLLACDDENNIWVGTSTGIDKFDTHKKSFTHYGKEEGFLGIEINPNAVCKDNAGNLWFGSVAGAVKYDARKNRINIMEPLTQITRIKVFSHDVDISSSNNIGNVFTYNQNNITFEFIGISLTNPKKVRYQYKLEGVDSGWSSITQDNHITYPDLRSDTYTFLVRACNDDGVWNKEPVKYSFTIRPPFWQTKTFYLLCFVVMLVFIYLIVRWRLRSIRRENRILEQKVKERTEEIEQKNIELEKLSIVASKTSNAIVIFDSQGTIEWVNDTYTAFSGNSLEDLKRLNRKTLFEISGNTDIHAIYKNCISEKKPIVYESQHISEAGNKLWVVNTITPVLKEDGSIRNLIIITTDITERKISEDIIKQKNKDIIDSIVYAKRIQQAILPLKSEIFSKLPESFILYKPRDIVSGDFYWFTTQFGKILIATVDCTGHGVPGAFMSMIGNDVLNQVVKVKGIIEPAAILNNLNHGVRVALKQDKQDAETRDGMDIILCMIDKVNNRLEFAGAMRPLYLVRNGALEIIKPDKFPIGGITTEEEHQFTNNVIEIQHGDTIYLFTDGYIDQFGGQQGKKFMAKRLQQTLLEIQHLSMPQQEEVLNKIFEEWKGNLEQIDDILVIGIRF